MVEQLQVAIDGPASAGKSTVAKLVAKQFNFVYCDTGAMYRAITLAAIQAHVDLSDEVAVEKLVRTAKISFQPGEPVQRVLLDGQDITTAIRQPDITNNVSTIAAMQSVRAELVNQQRAIAQTGSIVMDGRDIGTTVLPNAQVKIFMVASAHERAVRRYNENVKKGIMTPLAQLQAEIELRDQKDSNRAVSPLKQAQDAILLDTTKLNVEQVVAEISQIIKKKQDELR